MNRRFGILALGVSLTLASSAAFACDMEGEASHQEVKSGHHSISLIPQAHADEAASGVKKAAFKVEGMMCSSCYGKVNGALTKLQGVQAVDIEKKKNIVTVTYLPEQTSPEAMLKAVDSVGFKAKAN